jgi:preprotein translocase subunit SecG
VEIALNLALILVSIALIVVVLLQGKGALSGGIFGGESLYTSRRGVEKTIFNITIGLTIAFVILSLAAFLVGR